MRFTDADLDAMRAAHREEIERFKEGSDYYTFTDIRKERGWPKGLIGELLGEPDDTRPNPYYKTGPNSMRLYSKVRVHAAEQNKRFVEYKGRRQELGRPVATGGSDTGEKSVGRSLELVPSVAALPLQSATSIIERAAYIYQRRLERESSAAKLAKAHHGYQCQACDMTFSDVYGEIGADFIEAHHLVPLADIEPATERTYSPEDFAVLCSNCHRMIHRWPSRADPKPWDLEGFTKMLRLRRRS